jgi:hypothetical protein
MKIKVYPVWRKAYEIPAVIAWLCCAGVMYFASIHSGSLGIYPLTIAAACVFFALVRASQVIILWEKKARLTQLPDYELSRDEIVKKVEKAAKLAKRGKLRVDE